MAELFPITIFRKSRPFTWSSDFAVATKRPGNCGSKSDNRFSTTSLDVTKVSILHVLFCCNRFVLNFDPNYFLLFSTPFLPQFVSFPVRIMLLINFNFGQFQKKISRYYAFCRVQVCDCSTLMHGNKAKLENLESHFALK